MKTTEVKTTHEEVNRVTRQLAEVLNMLTDNIATQMHSAQALLLSLFTQLMLSAPEKNAPQIRVVLEDINRIVGDLLEPDSPMLQKLQARAMARQEAKNSWLEEAQKDTPQFIAIPQGKIPEV